MRISDWSSDVCSSDLPFWAAWSPSTAAGRSELAPGSAGELAARPRPGAGMSTSITHLWRLVRWGRTLARHGALKGIERDPLTPPRVRLLCRVARFGARVPQQPAYEIGRASCRERVCQYVVISVVAVSLKKKT